MMDPPKALLERSFLQAVAQDDHADHSRAVDEYVRLVELYQREELLLVAVSDHAQRFPGMHHPWRQIGLRRTGVFAPVDFLWVGFQHRRAARRAADEHGLEFEMALTLTMAERHRIVRLVTLDPRFDAFELTILPQRDESTDDVTPAIAES
ncbi:MAG: hypothetical protein ABMA25_07985 [Ilumatobacteraceae bacterium]